MVEMSMAEPRTACAEFATTLPLTDTSTMGFEKRFLRHRGITVIQKLDPSLPRLRRGKVGIVLAGGAVSGGAFKAGGLRALDESFLRRRTPGQGTRPFGLGDFDVFVGLSAGSV